MNHRPVVGVMGGAANSLREGDLPRLQSLIDCLGEAIGSRKLALITGETSGIPGQVIEAAAKFGALTIGISPAHSYEEHLERYHLPAVPSDVVIYTGFGLKGRNVVNIRSSDIVVIFCGSIGTLNEFTIAYDEGKIIGVLKDSGGVADLIPDIVTSLAKGTKSVIVYESNPEILINKCLAALAERKSGEQGGVADR